MNLYIGINGDASGQIIVFAETQAEAIKLAKQKIKEDELEHLFPVLDFTKHEVKTGVVDVIESAEF